MIFPFGSKKKPTEADIDNILTESFLYQRFKLLALNQNKWNGLPETIEERYIERVLFEEGQAFMYNHPELGTLCLPCMGLGTPNVYGEFTRYRVMGFNFTDDVSAEDGVLIENNKLRMPTSEVVRYFIEQLYQVKRCRDMNIKQLKLQCLFATTDKNETTLKAILDEVDNNNWAVLTDKNVIDIDGIVKALPTGVKPILAELTDCYHDILNEGLTYLGLNNANTDKKERLITDEANANNQFIESCAEMFLEARKRACEEINKKLGLNVSVETRIKGEENNALELAKEHTTEQQQTKNN